MAIDRRAEKQDELRGGQLPQPCELTGAYPHLWEFGTEAAFSDGSHRPLPTLTVFVEDGVWKLCLNDRAEGEIAFTAGATLTDALNALERGLRDGTLDWRKPKPGSQRRKN